MSNNVDMIETSPMEESSTKIHQQKEDDDHHRQCVDELRTIFLQVHRYQQEPDKHKDELSQLHARGMHLCNKLRSLNRNGRMRIQKARELTAEHRNRLDDQTLEQQNLLYELSHINREIARCEEFKSKDQQLELVSVEDFYANAPPELTDSNVTGNDPHRLHLFQLDWELMQREKLHDDCKALQTEISDLKKQIVRRRKRLRSLRPKLKQVVKSTEPVRRYIESQFDDTNNLSQSINNPLIAKLPDPLYVLYSLVLAYQQCDGRHVTCQIESKEDSSTTNSSMDTNSDGIFINGDHQHQSLMRPHPLHVKMSLILSPDHTGELLFTFLPHLNIVTIQGKLTGLKAQQSQALTSTLLHNLLDDNDNGQLSPNPTTDFLFQQQGKSSPIFSDTNGGYPYHWIQQLCKCQMVPLQRQELATDCSEIIKRLTQRMRARIALDRILINLEKSEMPLLAEGHETTHILNSSLRRSINNLPIFRSCREITFDDIHKYEHIQTLINENLIDRITTSIYECKFQSLSQDENNKTMLYAHIFIPPNYPQSRSIILLKLISTINGNKTIERTRINSENIKIFERSLIFDVTYPSMISSGSGSVDLSQHFTLLAQQIWRLSIGFPLLIDAESNLTCTSRRRQTLLSRLID
ncbi:unnamed protein product [Adineta steineri]|uniref:THO complex subunit 5 n=1 Tax=Adineta steineri TaxID=433720 RepID=A0A813R0C3_9BILA|nr:unnamed protein product [Adineta steineri]CAF3717027.1 unnamed protein product [Adineta steineri]